MLYKVLLTYESVDEVLWCDHSNETCWVVLCRGTVYYAVQGESNFWTIQMKATEHFFAVVLFIMMNKVVLTFEPLWMKLCSVTIQITPFRLYFRKVPDVLEYNLQSVNTIFFKFANWTSKLSKGWGGPLVCVAVSFFQNVKYYGLCWLNSVQLAPLTNNGRRQPSSSLIQITWLGKRSLTKFVKIHVCVEINKIARCLR